MANWNYNFCCITSLMETIQPFQNSTTRCHQSPTSLKVSPCACVFSMYLNIWPCLAFTIFVQSVSKGSKHKRNTLLVNYSLLLNNVAILLWKEFHMFVDMMACLSPKDTIHFPTFYLVCQHFNFYFYYNYFPIYSFKAGMSLYWF